jgi:hypothetical protein
MAFQVKASDAVSQILYNGATANTAKL